MSRTGDGGVQWPDIRKIRAAVRGAGISDRGVAVVVAGAYGNDF